MTILKCKNCGKTIEIYTTLPIVKGAWICDECGGEMEEEE